MAFWLVTARVSAVIAMGIAFQAVAADRDRLVVAEIEEVSEHGALVLADGSERCLAGIRSPDATITNRRMSGWRAAWQKIIKGDGFFFQASQPAGHDRYGCSLGVVEDGDGAPLQQALLAAGWASVDPLSASKEVGAVDAMLALEERARSAGRGMWKHPSVRPKAAGDLSAWIGTHQLVEGRVRRVSETDRYVYLNFGNDWRTDFTTRLDRKMIETTGFDTTVLKGQKLRVRGVLMESRGPLIDIAHLKQIEFLP